MRFRRWSDDVLKRCVTQGAAVNEQRLEQLGLIVRILARSSDELVALQVVIDAATDGQGVQPRPPAQGRACPGASS